LLWKSKWKRWGFGQVMQSGAKGTIVFDWKSTLHAASEPGLVLTLGYNTAVFCVAYRLKGIANLINMDGIEWRRQKWSPLGCISTSVPAVGWAIT